MKKSSPPPPFRGTKTDPIVSITHSGGWLIPWTVELSAGWTHCYIGPYWTLGGAVRAVARYRKRAMRKAARIEKADALVAQLGHLS